MDLDRIALDFPQYVEQVAGIEADLEPLGAVSAGTSSEAVPFSGDVTERVTRSRSSAILTARVRSLAIVATRSTPSMKLFGSTRSSLSFAVGITRL